MQTLFFLSFYSMRLNEYSRILNTGPNEELAVKDVQEYLGPDWRLSQVRSICTTNTAVFTEL